MRPQQPLIPGVREKASRRRRRGRPPKTPAIRMYFAGYLHPGEDDDLIAWYQSLPQGKRFPTLVAMLRSGGAIGQVMETDARTAEDAAEKMLDAFLVE